MDFAELRLEEILEKTGCTTAEFYLTGDHNFRHDLATIQPYKGNRNQRKPYHYQNMRNWLQFRFNAEVEEGMEADDILGVLQSDNTCIVSRDKDLRMVPGWHYGYAAGKQQEQPLEYIEEIGYLTLDSKRKLRGGGLKWFYAQCIMGDTTDNIQGLPKGGPVLAFNTLNELNTNEEMYNATSELYKTALGDSAEAALLENARLVWMVRELNGQGDPVMWEPPS